MAFFQGAVLQLQADNRILARKTDVKAEVRQAHDLLVVNHGVVHLVLTERHTVTHLVQTIAVLLADLPPALVAQLLFNHFGHLRTRGTPVHTGVHQVKDAFGQLATVDMNQLRHVLHAQHEAAAELTRLRQRLGQLRNTLQARRLVDNEPHAAIAVFSHALQHQRGQ